LNQDSTTASARNATSGALRERFWTALALALVTIAAVIWLPTAWLGLALLPAIGLAGWELAALLGVNNPRARWAYLFALAMLVGLLWFSAVLARPLLLLIPITAFWLALIPALFRVARIEEVTRVDRSLLLLSAPIILAPWIGALSIHATGGSWILLFVFMLVWLTDSAAYFAGRRFGRRKLAPQVSPGKTVEGVMGGLLAAGLWSLALIPVAANLWSWLWLALLCILTAVVSVVGDLLESWLKRRRNLKDAGSLLPGHGGVLDRLDSLVAALPVFAVGFLLWEKTL
jgi:phosphatidate cytidylyltransferase